MVIASDKSTIASSIFPANKTSAKTIEFSFYDRKGKKIIKKWLPKFSSLLTIYWSAVLVTIFPILSTVCLISIFHYFQVSLELYFPPCGPVYTTLHMSSKSTRQSSIYGFNFRRLQVYLAVVGCCALGKSLLLFWTTHAAVCLHRPLSSNAPQLSNNSVWKSH